MGDEILDVEFLVFWNQREFVFGKLILLLKYYVFVGGMLDNGNLWNKFC